MNDLLSEIYLYINHADIMAILARTYSSVIGPLLGLSQLFQKIYELFYYRFLHHFPYYSSTFDLLFFLLLILHHGPYAYP